MEAFDGEEGYVGARIEQDQGTFDAGAYSFFGDMAPLDEGLGGALEDGLEAPPEELPASGALEDDDDLPIEALMDEEEDEDLSLAALLRRQMLAQGDEHGASSSKAQHYAHHNAALAAGPAVAAQKSSSVASMQPQHDQPLMPPMPPQPQMLSHLGQHAGAAPAAALPTDSSSAQSAVREHAVAAPMQQRPMMPSGMLTAGELEARMLSSANAAAQHQPPQAVGGQLLSMLKAGSGANALTASPQLPQQQLQAPPLHIELPHPGLMPGAMPGQPPFGPGMPPPGGLEAIAHMQRQQQHLQQLPDGMSSGPYPPMGPYNAPPPHMLPPGHPLQAGPMPLGPPPGHPMHGAAGPMPHPGMLHPGMAGPPPPGTPGGPLPWPHGQPPVGMPPRGPHMPGQLAPPRGMPPPGFPGAPPPQHLQQLPPGYKASLPGLEQQQLAAGALAPQQHQMPLQQQQQGLGGPRRASPPPQQSPTSALTRPSALLHHQHQHQQQVVPRQLASSGPGSGIANDPSSAEVLAAPAGDQNVAALVYRFRTYGSEMMGADEINFILRIQHQATHGGHPYLEDFYYQAYLNKYYGARNAIIFAPAELRDISEGHEGNEPRFADLSGLGKIVLSNIRTPKMLMDLGSLHSSSKHAGAATAAGAGQPAAEPKARPLEQEPMLAARIMIEDCMLLLSDVEDIDRMFTATSAAMAAGTAPHGTPGPISPSDAQKLLHRRSALLGGIAASFRLPDQPTLPAADAAATTGGDGVFIRLMRLPKGRSLVAKTLRLMFSAPPSVTAKNSKLAAQAGVNGVREDSSQNSSSASARSVGLDVIWALLRNIELSFGPAVAASPGQEADRRMTSATVSLSAAASEMVKRVTKPEEAVACLAACNAGLEATAAAATASSVSQLLPLFPAGRVPSDASPDWLGSVLASLLLRASELGLGSFAAAGNVRTLGEGYDREAREIAEQEAREAAGGASAAAAAEWQRLLTRFTELIMLHLWGLVQAARSGGVVAVPTGGTVDIAAYIQQLACVPLMRVLMAHCDAEQQEQLRSYLSEVSH